MCSAASVLACDHGRASGPACEEPSDADAAKGATSLLAWDAARAAIEVVLSAHEATRARAVVACLPTDDEDRAVLRERLRRPLRFLVAQACRRAALEGVLPCGGQFPPLGQLLLGGEGWVLKGTKTLKGLLDVGLCGIIVNVAVFILVSFFSPRPEKSHREAFARDLKEVS